MRPTSEESLELHASNTPISGVSENQTTNIDDALAVRPELELAVALTDVVQADAHGHGVRLASFEVERTTTDGSAVGGVALRVGHLAYFFVGGVGRIGWIGQVCV